MNKQEKSNAELRLLEISDIVKKNEAPSLREYVRAVCELDELGLRYYDFDGFKAIMEGPKFKWWPILDAPDVTTMILQQSELMTWHVEYAISKYLPGYAFEKKLIAYVACREYRFFLLHTQKDGNLIMKELRYMLAHHPELRGLPDEVYQVMMKIFDC
jgi:hypothetical protein